MTKGSPAKRDYALFPPAESALKLWERFVFNRFFAAKAELPLGNDKSDLKRGEMKI